MLGAPTLAELDRLEPERVPDAECCDVDEEGRPVLHTAAVPALCGTCSAPIDVGDPQSVQHGSIVCMTCAHVDAPGPGPGG